MRVSESQKRKYERADKVKENISKFVDKVIDILAKPLEAFDYWEDKLLRRMERYLEDKF